MILFRYTGFVIAILIFGMFAANAGQVESRIELKQTGESARVHNPACATGASITAADLILKATASVIDNYSGYPIAAPILDRMPPGNRDWLKVRIGIHDGKSTCASLCVVYPKNVKATHSTCLSETGGDGLGCFSNITEDAQPPSWAAIQSFSTAETANSKVFCATGKNWSHNRDRWFTVKAAW